MIPQDQYTQLIRHATKAPSSHNTQPWKFHLHGDEVHLYPDHTRSLPVVDTDHHALFISLGCALENLVIAAQQHGYGSEIKLESAPDSIRPSDAQEFPDQSEPGIPNLENPVPQVMIRTRLRREPGLQPSPLFMYIHTRQVTKTPYADASLDPASMDALRNIAPEEGTRIHILEKGEHSDRLLPFILEGSRLQFTNPDFKNELIRWIRFSKKEAMRTGDGIWHATMGLPATGRPLGRWIMKNVATAGSEDRRWQRLFRQSGAYAILTVSKNTLPSWIALGRTFQRFALETTRLDICHAHMNMPLEEISTRKHLADSFGLTSETPLLLLRLGKAEPAVYSFRRNIHAVNF